MSTSSNCRQYRTNDTMIYGSHVAAYVPSERESTRVTVFAVPFSIHRSHIHMSTNIHIYYLFAT